MMYGAGVTAETAALTVDGPQPVWMTLKSAREQAFTGEIVFETAPEVFAYLDNGIVYYAERAADVSLGRRLLDAGVVDNVQLERGTVRVGDIEHLGRLFDRDPSVDRDAVLVLAETATQDLISELAKHSIAAVRFTAYRHHPSGVHRWFVAPLDPVVMARPVSAGRQLDATFAHELPGLPIDDGDDTDLVIEWDDGVDQTSELHADVFEMSLELADFTDADADEAATPSDVEPIDALGAFDSSEPEGDGSEFSVVWPDGAEESATPAIADEVEALDAELDALDAELDAALAESDDHNILRLTMPPLELSDEPESVDAEESDDVAEAVRRAIAAIESASATDDVIEPATALEAPDGTPGGLGGFAPPTMATSAEALYAQMDAEDSMVETAPNLDEPSASDGVASVESDDDPAADGSDAVNDRNSALRRLIGSLHRKDH